MDVAEKKTDIKYTYSFSAWPDETWGFKRALFDLFGMLNGRVEMNFMEREFEHFRSQLGHDGFTLREVERWPYVEPESVR